MNSVIYTIDEGKSWANVLDRLVEVGGDDIYFKPQYLSLYATGQARAEAFVYEDKHGVFMMPYLRCPVNERLCPGNYFDIESPYGYCGPLTNNHNPDFILRAWDSLKAYCKETRIIAGFVRFHSLLNNHLFIQAAGIDGVLRSNEVVTLNLVNKKEDDIWKGYSPNTRTHIRRAEQKNVKIVRCADREGLQIFQDLYYKTMDQVSAKEYYYFDDAYFDRIAHHLAGSFEVFLALVEGVYIGGALVWVAGKHVHYHLSANLKEYREYSAASALRHAVIMAYLNSPYQRILFGGGKTALVDDSLLQFKQGFSKERADFYIGKFIFDNQAYTHACQEWEEQFPSQREIFKQYFLRYKYT